MWHVQQGKVLCRGQYGTRMCGSKRANTTMRGESSGFGTIFINRGSTCHGNFYTGGAKRFCYLKGVIFNGILYPSRPAHPGKQFVIEYQRNTHSHSTSGTIIVTQRCVKLLIDAKALPDLKIHQNRLMYI